MQRGWLGLIVIALAACSGSNHNGESTSSGSTSSGSTETASTSSGATSSESPAPAAQNETASSDAGTQTASAAPASSASPAPVELPAMPTDLHGPPTPWDHMNAHQRADYMEHSVLPAMSALLQAYDAHDYAHVTCATCHGTDARAVHFRMPNRLPTLPRFGTDASRQSMAEHPRMYAFMHERVVPTMAQLLGVAPYDPHTQQGFGCANCHHFEGAH